MDIEYSLDLTCLYNPKIKKKIGKMLLCHKEKLALPLYKAKLATLPPIPLLPPFLPWDLDSTFLSCIFSFSLSCFLPFHWTYKHP